MQRLNGGAEGDRTLDLRIAKARCTCRISLLRSFRGPKRAYSGGGGARMWHTDTYGRLVNDRARRMVE
jgi:hypothetical protein